MAYSLDLRKRVLDFITAGGSKTQASHRFSVARSTLYKWLNAPDPLARQKPGPRRPRSLDPDALRKHVADFPDQTYAERSSHFGISKSCIGYGLENIDCTRKKTSDIRSDASINDRHIFSNSQTSKPQGSLSFMPMKVVSETKAIDATGMPRKARSPFMGLSQVNAIGHGHCLLRVSKGFSLEH